MSVIPKHTLECLPKFMFGIDACHKPCTTCAYNSKYDRYIFVAFFSSLSDPSIS